MGYSIFNPDNNMNLELKLSIVIPIYNAEKYLEECISSIINQDYPNFEIILINDGSTDSSENICMKFMNSDSRVFYQKTENHGASHARNIGIELATGDYIWFIDADDWINPNSISSLMSEMSSDIMFFGFKQIFENGDTKLCQIVPKTQHINYNDIAKSLDLLFTSKDGFFGYTWDKIFKLKIIQQYNIRFIIDLTIKEDEVFTFEYCKHITSLTISSYTPYNYRILRSSISHSNKRKNLMELASYFETNIFADSHFINMKMSLCNAIYTYRLQAIFEEVNSLQYYNAIDLFLSWYKKYKSCLNIPKKHQIFFLLPTKKLKYAVFKIYINLHNYFIN